MKKIVASLLLLCLCVVANAQSDTLYTKKQKKVICKITEINDLDIKYTLAGNSDGPVFVVSKATIYKYTLANGYTELIVPDELSLENEHMDIIKNRQVIKINPFCLVNTQISIAYEKVIRVGMNLDVEVGYINNSMNKNPLIPNRSFGNQGYFYYGGYNNTDPVFSYGGYVKPGIKYFLGQDYSVKGLKYAHPLKGRYIRLELALSYLNFQNIKRYEYLYSYAANTNTTKTITTNIASFAYGGLVSYGRQFILGNILTLEYYVSLGITGQTSKYSNPAYEVKDPSSPNYYSYNHEELNNINNYHGFLRSPIGLTGSAGFRVGYILPDKKKPGSHKK